jgi:hypothetical protein
MRKDVIAECTERWMTDKRRNGWLKHYGEIDGRDGLMVGCTCVWVDGWMDVLFVVAVAFLLQQRRNQANEAES